MDETGEAFAYADPTSPDSNNSLWMGSLIRYYAAVDAVRLCPTAPIKQPLPVMASNPAGTNDAAWVWTLAYQANPALPQLAGSYSLNGWMYDSGVFNTPSGTKITVADNNPQWLFGKETAIVQPSLTPYFSDSVWVDCFVQESDFNAASFNLYSPAYSSGSGILRNTINRHGGVPPRNVPTSAPTPVPGAANVGFSDGHAENAKLRDYKTFSWHVNWVGP